MKCLSPSHGNDAVKIGFVLLTEVFYFKFHQVHALTHALTTRGIKTSNLGALYLV